MRLAEDDRYFCSISFKSQHMRRLAVSPAVAYHGYSVSNYIVKRPVNNLRKSLTLNYFSLRTPVLHLTSSYSNIDT
jgi:hypothetical protein